MTSEPICMADFEQIASNKIPRSAWNYYSMGADDQLTLVENCDAYDRLRIRPRFLQGIDNVNMKTKILGQEISMPICIAPTALHKLACNEGECATARAAASMKTCMTLSVYSSTSWKDVAESSVNSLLFANLYLCNDKTITYNIVRHAEKAGFKAFVVTVDGPVPGNSFIMKRQELVVPKGVVFENYEIATAHIDEDLKGKAGSIGFTSGKFSAHLFHRNQCWNDIDWLRSITELPIILKGILTREDALEALKHDVQGILVSNHGGRQLDGVPATIEALPEIVEAVNGKIEVYVDGGIRRGTDVFKALALGAKAVFLGRPVLWGLGHDGEEGVKEVLHLLKEEFERTMILAGCKDVSEITSNMVVHESYFWKTPRHKL